MSNLTIALIGNPNCGKTTLFNALTGANQRVGNWAGVTVERKEGKYRYHNEEIVVVDLPGIYSLDVEDASTSLDEMVARDYLISNSAHLIINIIDASNLERNLYLTTQLLEMRLPMIIALNMMDIALKREIKINPHVLAKNLGTPVIPMSVNAGQGVSSLQEAIYLVKDSAPIPEAYVAYPPVIEEGIAKLQEIMQAQGEINKRDRSVALNLLQYEDRVAPGLNTEQLLPVVVESRRQIHQTLGDDVDLLIADTRYTWINQKLQGVIERTHQVKRNVSDRIDQVVLNRFFGIPIFLLIMYLMFFVSINIGGAFIDFFDITFATIFVDGVAHLLEKVQTPGWLIGLLANGVGGGIQTTATFIPQIGLLFVCLSLLEDSGYLARAAFVMDRLMQWIGLPGKSFIPMMVGFGCNIPGIMATRTLENKRDRLMTVMMNPFMSCGARLPVYALFCAAFFPTNGQNIVFMLYVLGIGAAIFTGLVLKKTLFKGEPSSFIMELPPYHIPTFKGVMLRAWDRLKAFITKAGKMIVVMVIVLGLLNSVGTDGSFGKQDSQDSILSELGRTITPVFTPMGIQQENWPATVGLLTGVFAKEVMVGSMNSLYTELARQEASVEEEPKEYSFWGGISEAFQSIPNNLADLSNQLFDPLGLNVMGDVNNQEAAAETQEVSVSTFGQMEKRFGNTNAAIAFLLFVLLYFPCVSATAAVYRETNLGWTIFVGAWTTGLGYWAAVFYYQAATLGNHPPSSIAWIIGLILFMGGVLITLKEAGNSQFKSHKSEVTSQKL